MIKDRDRLDSYIRELSAKNTGYASFHKGIPGKDKPHEEASIAKLVLSHLKYPDDLILHSEPCGTNNPPDIGVNLPDGTWVGIEVTELVDEDVRKKHAERRAAEREIDLTPLAAFKARDKSFFAVRKKPAMSQPNPHEGAEAALSAKYVSPYYWARWDPHRVAEKLTSILRKKDKKLGNPELITPQGRPYDQVLLAVFTDEPEITRELLIGAIATILYRPTVIKRAFVVMGYDPTSKDCPIIDVM